MPQILINTQGLSNLPATAICSATAGSWALLVSDGTNWEIMAGA